ncbi:MAG TPA: nucleoside triphosphate pyrophosphohydrolase [Marinospirillum sp.]|uniref:nucleoside triphosphate pyrophosphohydrolase n=1 Tax=Marinospirillum sp. TaxID=2183934 RepID=UPI002B46C9A9|nr:nucleoside triphosphate pyrophosphohydrolase [Marinospirillum sp.]HKM15502.1 nucleoside triphosphate pyrophosphohydrolase [Marinospirillum sp.]
MQRPYALDDLLNLMARLRDPETGCPWDLKQTRQSLVPHTLEEVYEVVECIEANDVEHLKEELGDLLLQVIFYAQLANEEQRYNFADIVDVLTNKLVTRHPHIFPDGELYGSGVATGIVSEQPQTPEEVSQLWQKVKAAERELKGELPAESLLDGVPLNLPAMTRAVKLQKKAAKVGFDWDDPLLVLDKMEEELAEIREALAAGNQDEVAAEMGDFIFASVNLARHLKVDPESAVRSTNRKFEQRFKMIETLCLDTGKPLTVANQADAKQRFSLEQLDVYWEAAKLKESQLKESNCQPKNN